MNVDIIVMVLSFIIGMRVGIWAYKQDIIMGRCYKVCYVGVIKITYREFFPDDITNIKTTTYSFGRKSQQLVKLLKPK